jgi:hypothetical protein
MKNELVTIATFNTSPEMGLVRSKLDSEGIECFVKDELTTQTYLTNVVGGMKLQVYAGDADRAKEIVKEMGVYNEPGKQESGLTGFDRVTSQMPLIGNLSLVVRFFAFLVLIAILLSALYVLVAL